MKQNLYYQLANNFELKIGGVVEIKKGNDLYVLVYQRIYGNRREKYLEWTRGGVTSGSVENNVMREIKEETGLNVRVVRPLMLNIYQAPKINYTDCQIYFICQPIKSINVDKVWRHQDSDPKKKGKRWYECHFVKAKNLKPSNFRNGQDKVIRYYLKTINQ